MGPPRVSNVKLLPFRIPKQAYRELTEFSSGSETGRAFAALLKASLLQ
jgi:hypothetical protein